VAAVIALPKQGKLVWCDDQGAFREDLSSGNISELKRGANVSEAISVNSRDRAWLSAEGIGMRLPWVSSGSSIFDFIGSAVGELQGSVVGSQRLWDLMAPLAVADYLGMTLRDLKTGEVVTALSESDLSPDLVLRPWGLNRRMVLLPREQSIEALLQRS
jgi:fructose-1,6-bisphosphatase/inositol monophosphatase family enzyme